MLLFVTTARIIGARSAPLIHVFITISSTQQHRSHLLLGLLRSPYNTCDRPFYLLLFLITTSNKRALRALLILPVITRSSTQQHRFHLLLALLRSAYNTCNRPHYVLFSVITGGITRALRALIPPPLTGKEQHYKARYAGYKYCLFL